MATRSRHSLTNLVPVALARVPVLLLLARVPLLLVLDVEQERAQAVEQSRDEIGQLAHHPRRAIAAPGERHQKLRREVTRAILQVVVLRHRHHRLDDVRQVFTHESRIGPRQLHEEAERFLRIGLVAPLQRAPEGGEHRREQVLELAAIGGILEGLDEAAARAQGGELDGPLGGLQALREDAVQRGEVGHEGFADVLGELGEDVEGALAEVGRSGGDALEEKGEELGPLSVLEDAGGELAHGVAHLAGDGLDGFLLDGLEELALDAVLGLGLEVGPEGHLVLGEDTAKEDGGHLAGLLRGAGAQRADQLQAQHVGLLLALVEERLVLRARGVVGAAQAAQELLEGGEGGHVEHRGNLRGGHRGSRHIEPATRRVTKRGRGAAGERCGA